ncbi:MAG: hypothetical protein WBG43_05010 [Marinifilaceae bacterium]|jgi:hypothetical protein
MKKKIYIAIILVLMLCIIFIAGAPIEPINKNTAELVCFVGIGLLVYLIMREKKEEK